MQMEYAPYLSHFQKNLWLKWIEGELELQFSRKEKRGKPSKLFNKYVQFI